MTENHEGGSVTTIRYQLAKLPRIIGFYALRLSERVDPRPIHYGPISGEFLLTTPDPAKERDD